MKKLFLIFLVLALLGACTMPAENVAEATLVPASPSFVATQTSAPSLSPEVLPTATVSPTATALPFTPTPTGTAPATATATATGTATGTPTPEAVEFAVIGDYGLAGPAEAEVASLVDSWEPDFIITVGDNNYPDGEAETIDANIGQYYSEYIYPYQGEYTSTVSTLDVNRFFPSLGNHDFYGPDGAQPYLDYFTLPDNERYYSFGWGPLHLFALNSDHNEPDGVDANSVQAQWLREELAASTAPWKLVYMHVPPFSSGHHGSGTWMRWPFEEWDATAVLSGHDHHYERLLVNGIPYFVNGLGGGAIYAFGEILPQSQVRFTGTHGAMRVEASSETITFEFVTSDGELIDSYTMTK